MLCDGSYSKKRTLRGDIKWQIIEVEESMKNLKEKLVI